MGVFEYPLVLVKLQSESLCSPLLLCLCVSVCTVAACLLGVLSRVTCRVHRM